MKRPENRRLNREIPYKDPSGVNNCLNLISVEQSLYTIFSLVTFALYEEKLAIYRFNFYTRACRTGVQ
jgi:hypothetical protein